MPTTSETQAFELTGGFVWIHVGQNTVEFVSASPKTGFITKVEKTGPEEVEVTFTSNTHKSKFRAEFEDGELDVRIREESENDDDDD